MVRTPSAVRLGMRSCEWAESHQGPSSQLVVLLPRRQGDRAGSSCPSRIWVLPLDAPLPGQALPVTGLAGLSPQSHRDQPGATWGTPASETHGHTPEQSSHAHGHPASVSPACHPACIGASFSYLPSIFLPAHCLSVLLDSPPQNPLALGNLASLGFHI